MARKPTIRRGGRGSDLFSSLLDSTDDLSSRTRRSVARSNSSRDTVDLAIQESERAISSLKVKLEMLEKTNPNYEQLKKSLTKDIELENSRIQSNKKLKDLLKASATLLQAVTEDYKKKQSLSAKGLSNTANLAKVTKQIKELQESTDYKLVEIDDLFSTLKNTVDADQMKKLEKKLERFEAIYANPLQRSGAVGAGAKTVLTGLLGPLGEVADDVFNISGGFERLLTRGVAKLAFGKKAKKSQGDLAADQLREQVEETSKDAKETKEKAEKIITLITEEEQEEELEDRKKAIREKREKLIADRKGKEVVKEQKSWLSSFMSKILGSKLTKILGFAKYLSPRGFGMLLTKTLFGGGKLLARIGGTLGRMILSPLLSGASSLLFRVLPSLVAALPGFLSTVLNPVALLAAAGFAGFKLGEWLYENYSEEILDGIDWVVNKVKGAFSFITDTYDKARNATSNAIESTVNFAKDTYSSAVNKVSTGIEKTANFVSNTASQISGFASWAWNGARSNFDYSTDQIVGMIKNAAQTVGVPESWLYSTAVQESSLNPKAKAPTSSATGLFQFINSTWASMVSKYGAKYGIGMGDRENPQASAIMGALFMKDNMNSLQAAGLPVTYSSVYGAHFLGSAGIKKLLSANPTESGAKLFPDAARANKNVFFNENNQPRTVAEILSFFGAKLKKVGSFKPASVTTSHPSSAVTTSTPGRSISNTSNTYIMAPQDNITPNIPTQSPVTGITNMDEIPMYPKDSEALIGIVLGQLA